jgi:hypothetical protein
MDTSTEVLNIKENIKEDIKGLTLYFLEKKIHQKNTILKKNL